MHDKGCLYFKELRHKAASVNRWKESILIALHKHLKAVNGQFYLVKK